MEFRRRLAQTLVDESRAYGYTLVIWGAGAMLIAEYGVPDPLEVLTYIAGSLLGFTALTYYAFDGVLTSAQASSLEVETAAEMVHLVATFLNLVASIAFVTGLGATAVAQSIVYGIVGFQATVGYSVFLVVEDRVGEYWL